ncbi:MAG: Arc family DNA-binding protein [Caulobacter sp.]|nr:Arc family DNA-binding protein [Caulobacter sp.]
MASPGKRAFLLRVKPEVLDAVERLAADELRSVNAQLEVLIREGLAKRGRLKGPAKGEPEGQGS